MAFHLHTRLLSAAIVATFSCVAFAAPSIAAETPRFNISSLTANQKYDRFIIRYRAGTTDASTRTAMLQSVSAAISRAGLNHPGSANASLGSSGVAYVRQLATGAHVVRTNKLSKSEAAALIQQIATDPAVAHVEPDVKMHAISDFRGPSVKTADFSPNDPKYASYQWHLRSGDGTTETVGGDTSAYANRGGAGIAKAWDLTDGQGVTVAVLDTGITHHPDLDTSLSEAGYDFISDASTSGRTTNDRVPGGWDLGDWTTEAPWNEECRPSNSSWHGTHVSGTIAEMTNNDVGMAGSAFGAKVLPVRVLGHCGGYTSDIAEAIVWASGGHVDGVPDNANPAQVINMSLGGLGSCTAADETGMAIADAISRGTTVVVAAGNEEDDTVNYSPSSCPGVVNVAAVGITGKRAVYSNHGNLVTLAAPGGGVYANDAGYGDEVYAGFVWSTLNGSLTAPDENNYVYGGMAGTSQATPHVAGTVALVISALNSAGLPALSPSKMKALLTSTARSFPTKPDETIGAGIVDAYAAVQKAISGTPGGGNPEDGIMLDNGGVLNGIFGASGDTILYKVTIPADTSALVLRTFGGTGDVSLYVKRDQIPTTSDYDRAAVHAGNNESVTLSHPAAGTYYLLVSGVKAFDGLSVQASYRTP
jgi:serine protease